MFILFPLRNLENKNSENADIKVLSSTFLNKKSQNLQLS